MAVTSSSSDPDFLLAQPGDFVVVMSESNSPVEDEDESDWWIGHILHVTSGARSPRVNSIFQVVDIDTGCIATINADLVKRILY